jgi:hypothetical protein
VRPILDSIALPVAKWLRGEAERRERKAETDRAKFVQEVEFLQSQLQTRIEDFKSEINERVTRLESTERVPLER